MSVHVKTDDDRDAEVIERVAAAMWWQEFGYDRGVTWEQRVRQELDHRTDPSWSGPVARYRRLARAALSALDPTDSDAGPSGSGHSPSASGGNVADSGGSVEEPSTHLIHGPASAREPGE